MNLKTSLVTISMISTLMLPIVAVASTQVESRGFASCQTELNARLSGSGLVLDSKFEVARKGSKRVFFVNGTAWADDGTRTKLQSRCTTDRVGRQVISLETKSEKSIDNGRSIAVR